MAISFAASFRSPGPRRIREASSASRYAIYTSVGDLVAMRVAARDFGPRQRRPVRGLLPAGRHHDDDLGMTDLSRATHAERGLDRTLEDAPDRRPDRRLATDSGDAPHPALFVVDQRLDMFFGSRRSMKAVAAAETAALCAWRMHDCGEPVGGVVFNDALIDALPPDEGGAGAMALIEAICTQNAGLRADWTQPRAPTQLDAAIEAATRLAGQEPSRRHLIVVISDFRGHGRRTRERLIKLAANHDVIAVLVYDPFLLDLPKNGDVIVTGGELQVDLDFGAWRIRRSLFDFAEAPATGILAFERTIGVPVLPLSAAEETAPQLARLFDQPRRRAGV